MYGERTVTRFAIDILLFSCMATFVTGIVIVAAKFVM